MTKQIVTLTALQKRNEALKAPAGVRLGGPGTRSKNPTRYDANKKA